LGDGVQALLATGSGGKLYTMQDARIGADGENDMAKHDLKETT
jgi:hypothetical protein